MVSWNNNCFESRKAYLGPIKTSINDQLQMYSLYKQATSGKCDTIQPYFFQIEQRMKWNAWNQLGNMDEAEAKAQYVEKMLKLVCYWDYLIN